MGGILQVDTIQNNNTSTLITQTNATTITVSRSGQTVTVPSGASLAVDTIKNTNLTTLITQTNATTITIGTSGNTITIPSGVTFNTASASISLPAGSISNADINATAAIATTKLGTGAVLQVVSASKTDTFSSATTGSFVDITGLSVSITPSATANKILVMYYVSTGGDFANGAHFLRLVRGSTAIFSGDSVVGRTLCTTAQQPASTQTVATHSIQFLDSPNTTSSTTYKVQLFNTATTGYINRSYTDNDNSSYPRSVSSITVMEIKG